MPLSSTVCRQLDDLVIGLVAIARDRSAKIASLTVGVAVDLAADDVSEALGSALAARGLPAATIRVQRVLGGPRLLAVEYHR